MVFKKMCKKMWGRVKRMAERVVGWVVCWKMCKNMWGRGEEDGGEGGRLGGV